MKQRALVVEDDSCLGELTVLQLERAGYRATLARHKREACRLLDEREFDFVLLDLALPEDEKDFARPDVGFAILDEIRSRFSKERLPVLVMSACARPEEAAARALAAQATDFIEKPFSSSAVSLEDKIAAMLGRPASARSGRALRKRA